ncbi:MAG: chemotaxis protein CheX [Bdellovibrionaceae bacterium]|nr:chemotaxis protein CheX [Pseudobdellovibrionaceae bacterium]
MTAAKKTENPLLSRDFVNQIVQNVLNTLDTMANIHFRAQGARIEHQLNIRGDVAGIIGLTHPAKGNLIFSFPKATILHICNNMLGENHTEISAEVRDSVGELTNIFYGAAKSDLSKMGFKCEMALPTVVYGDFQIVSKDSGLNLVVKFEEEKGHHFEFHACVG